MKESTAVAAEIARAFMAFEATYPNKWLTKPSAVEVWADILSDLKPEEVREAASVWCRTNNWPPSPAELRGSVPRFCRCGKCYPCHRRAVDRAGRALERGAVGADFETPERIALPILPPPTNRLTP